MIKPRNYHHLVEYLRSRRKQVFGLSQLAHDEQAGWQGGYTGKLEKPLARYGRNAGPHTLFDWLGSLGLELVIVPIPQRTKKTSDPRQLEFPFDNSLKQPEYIKPEYRSYAHKRQCSEAAQQDNSQ